MKTHVVLALLLVAAILIGCGEPQPLPETVSKPKPAKLDKNAFVRAE